MFPDLKMSSKIKFNSRKYVLLLNYKLQNQILFLSKLITISASTMGIQSLILCLLQFLSFFSFVLAIPTEPLRSYVDCSKYGNPHVSIYTSMSVFTIANSSSNISIVLGIRTQACLPAVPAVISTADFHINIIYMFNVQVVIPNGKCFYGPSDWQTYPALPSFVLNEYPSGVYQSSLLLQVQDQDTVPYRFEVMDSTWSGPSENEEFICICYWFL